jgi:hypothetical protein
LVGGTAWAEQAASSSADQATADLRHDRQPPAWGIYQIYWNAGRFQQQLARETARFASKPQYVMFYRDLGRPFPHAAVQAIRAAGATPIVSLELWHWHKQRQPCLPEILRGRYDDFFESWANEAKRDGQLLLLRFGFEFNGEWFPWSGDPDSYVAAWRRVRRIFNRAAAGNVEWVWCPNILSVPDTPANGRQRYYPGDEYVDWVGLDGYNWGDDHDQWHSWQSFDEIHHAALEDLGRRYPTKPIIVGETACVSGSPGQKAAWIRDAHHALAHHPRVKAVVWFHYDKRAEGEPNWRVDTSPDALQAFNETFAAERRR